MNSIDLKNKIIEDVESLQDDICLVMVSVNNRLVFVPKVGKVYDKFSRVWHTLRNIRIDLCFDVKKESFRNPKIVGQRMNKQYLILFLDDIIKRIKHITISLRDISNTEPKFFDGITPRNIIQAYQANNSWLTLEDVKRIINEE